MHDRFRNLVYGVALALMAGHVLHVASGVLIPIVIALIVAYIVGAFARALTRVPSLGPLLPSPLRYTLAILTVTGGLALVISLVITNIGQLATLVPQMQARVIALVQDYAVHYGFEAEPVWEILRRDVIGAVNLQGLIRSTAVSATSLVGGAFVVIVYAAFLLVESPLFVRKLGRLSREAEDTARLRRIFVHINDRIGEYLAAKTLINVILGSISWVILVVAGLPLAAFWAVFIAMLNYIPYVGSVVGVAFPTAMALIHYDDPQTVLLLFIALSAAQLFVGSIVEPRLLGRALNLSPFVILLAVTAWGTLWGIAGALLAVPITASLTIIFSEFEGTRGIAILLSRSGRIGTIPDEVPEVERAA